VAARLARCRSRVDKTLHGAVLEGALSNLSETVRAAAGNLGLARNAGRGTVEAEEVLLGARDSAAREGVGGDLGGVVGRALAGGIGGGGSSQCNLADCHSLLVAPGWVGRQRRQAAARPDQVVAVRVAARLARSRSRVDKALNGAVLESALSNLSETVRTATGNLGSARDARRGAVKAEEVLLGARNSAAREGVGVGLGGIVGGTLAGGVGSGGRFAVDRHGSQHDLADRR